MTDQSLDRLTRRRAALQERFAKLEAEAISTARAECGPIRADPAYQAAFDVSKERAFKRGADEIQTALAGVDTEIAALEGKQEPRQAKEQSPDKAQEEAIKKALSAEFNKAAKAPGPTQDFNQLAERDR